MYILTTILKNIIEPLFEHKNNITIKSFYHLNKRAQTTINNKKLNSQFYRYATYARSCSKLRS